MKKIIMSFLVVVLLLGMTGIATAYSIKDDATGGDCTSIGIWDWATKTCTLTKDVYETIQIDSDYITLDGNGHTVTGTGYQEVVYLLSRTGVMIKNLNVKNADYSGITLRYSNNNTLTGNTVSNNYFGIMLYFSNSNTITDNTAEYNTAHGIHTLYSTNNTFTGNTVSRNHLGGFYFDNSNNNTLTDNIVLGNTGAYGGICLDRDSSNNSLVGNIVLNNTFGFVIFGGYNNAFVANTACNNTTWAFFVNGLVTESDNICDKVCPYAYPFKCIPCSMAGIDYVPPTVTASPSILWPPNHKLVDLRIDGSATDDMSGIASVVITVTDEYGIYNMTVPQFGSIVQLEAWRDGTDKNGRIYTVTVVATDNAGNQSTDRTEVIVPHDMRK